MQSTFESRQVFYQKLLRFPPFFTLQQHQQTRRKQILYWGQILINYFKKNKMVNSSVPEIMNLPIIQDKSTSIPKKLMREQLVVILQNLVGLGSIEFKQGTEAVLILHFSAFELADEIYKWAKANFLINDVETVHFITNGKKTKKEDKFYDQPKEIILKAISVLEKQGKAELMDMGGEYSVKFL